MYQALSEDQRVFSSIYAADGGMKMTLGTGTATEKIRVQMVSGSYFSLLGISPSIGRLISVEDDAMGHPKRDALGALLP